MSATMDPAWQAQQQTNYMMVNLHHADRPPFARYKGQDSFFGGEAPLSVEVGYVVVIGFGLFFSLVTTLIFHLNKRFGNGSDYTSEHFSTAGRLVKTGLTASVIVGQWTWAATLLQSSNVAWAYGVSGPFW